MDWTKVSTDLITKRFTDYELASIVKFQLVWALNEERPDENTCLRYMTKKQYETAMTYLDSVSARVNDDVSSVIKKRHMEKIRYNKNKDLSKNLQADSKQNVSSLSEQIRLDKIREDNIKEKEQEKEKILNDNFNEFWNYYTPIKATDGHFVAKGNKKSCQEKFNKIINKGVKYETIINGLKQYLTYCKENGMCSCGAEVFLNQRRWENDYSGNGTIQSNVASGLHRQSADIMETARQFAEMS